MDETSFILQATQLLEVVSPADGGVKFDYSNPEQKGHMSTGFRKEKTGTLDPYTRTRLIPGTNVHLKQYFAYKRDKAPTEVLHALKRGWNDSQVQHFVRRAAIYLAIVLRKEDIDAVMYAPSSSGLSQQFARELAVRLGNIPVLEPPEKLKKASKIGVALRMKAAKENFKVEDQPHLNGNILIADDFVTSGSTMVGIAANLLEIPDVKKVVGAGLAIY